MCLLQSFECRTPGCFHTIEGDAAKLSNPGIVVTVVEASANYVLTVDLRGIYRVQNALTGIVLHSGFSLDEANEEFALANDDARILHSPSGEWDYGVWNEVR